MLGGLSAKKPVKSETGTKCLNTTELETLNPKPQQHSQEALSTWVGPYFSLHKLLPLLLRRISALVGLGLILMGKHFLDACDRCTCSSWFIWLSFYLLVDYCCHDAVVLYCGYVGMYVG